jgi:glycosyltransferase involved in cell wall biosynthesis
MTNLPFFTIVIPTYNRANFISKSIKSVLNQEFQNFEIIVVDDGSTDNTEEVVMSIKSDKLYYHKKKNEERAVARNTGTRLAKGKYINFFDSDDLLYPNHLMEAYKFVEANSSPEFFHLGYDVKDIEGKVLSKVNKLNGNLNDKLIKGNFLSCNGVFLRKDIAVKHPFNEDRGLSASEDWELWLRLAAQYPLKHSNVITSTVINHEARSVLVINKEKLITRKKLLIKYLWEDPICLHKYGEYKQFVNAEAYTYIALHLAFTKKHKIDVLRYLLKSLLTRPATIGRRRFWATLKNVI